MNRALLAGTLLLASAAVATPSGKKWATLPSNYRVFSHASINGIPNFQADALPKVRNGFARWTTAQQSCTSWSSVYLGGFTTPAGKAALDGNDRQNRMLWLGGANWDHDFMTLGLTTTTFFQASGEIFDADVEMNNDRQWKVGGSGTRIDVESITTHEAGHYLGLEHTPSSSTVMFATYTDGAIKAALHATDISDVCTVYPKVSGGGTQGTFCAANPECAASAPVCRGTSPDSRICTTDCAAGQTCPANYTCQTDTTGGKSCLRPVGSPDLCKFCTTGSQCSTGICLTDGRHNWCSTSCADPTKPAASCGAGYKCDSLNGTSSYFCQPSTVCAGQCTSAAQCPVGYGCVGGQCEATGKAGDRCEVSTYCGPCTVCIGTTSEAHCRPCCGGTGGGGTCTACANGACNGTQACVQVSESADSICIPSDGVGTCQACDASRPCQGGLTCSNGRCLSACNPASPGACGACITSGSASLCACEDQISGRGESCADTLAGGRVCRNGLVCAGSPRTCHDPCTSDTNCDTGETCATRDGKKVCIPSDTPGTKCNPCASGTCGAGLVCYQGRCYTPCNVAAPTCSSCVDTAGGEDVCACDTEIASPGEFCGEAGGDVYGCAAGSVCVNQICRRACTPGVTVCEPGSTCQEYRDTHVCVGGVIPNPNPTDGGAPPRPDGGSHSPGTTGCGCGAGGTAGAHGVLLALLALGFASSRRRRA